MTAVDAPWGLIVALKTVVVLSVIPAGALILGYVFLLKMMSHMQSRLGPMDPGGFHGWFQLIGDGIKFIQKEDIIPAEADRRVFMAALEHWGIDGTGMDGITPDLVFGVLDRSDFRKHPYGTF